MGILRTRFTNSDLFIVQRLTSAVSPTLRQERRVLSIQTLNIPAKLSHTVLPERPIMPKAPFSLVAQTPQFQFQLLISHELANLQSALSCSLYRLSTPVDQVIKHLLSTATLNIFRQLQMISLPVYFFYIFTVPCRNSTCLIIVFRSFHWKKSRVGDWRPAPLRSCSRSTL